MGEKKAKPLVSVDCVCPGCKEKLRVDVHRKRTNPIEPPIYEYNTDVYLQRELDFEGKKTEKKSTKKKTSKK